MSVTRQLSRRDVLGAAGALGAAATASALRPAFAAPAPGTSLPARGEMLIRGAYVLSMDPAIGYLEGGDIHVRAGEIVAVGRGLRAPGARVIDARTMIALPGLVDAHNHLWNTPERSLVREGVRGQGYFPTTLALGKQYTPIDTYRGVRLGVAELLSGGVTTVNDWSHNLRAPAYVDADLQALHDTGIRARFSYGTYQGGPPPDQPMDTAYLTTLAHDWKPWSNEGLITLGIASRSVQNSPRGPANIDVLRKDWQAARSLGLPITIHANGAGTITVLDGAGLLGPDVQLVHPSGWTTDDLDAIARTKATVCSSPTTDVRLLYGEAAFTEMFKRNIIVSTSVDTAGVTGYCDLFGEMRMVYADQCARLRDPAALTPEQILAMATINGARDLGLGDRTGSLTPGKRADLILVRTTDLNMAPFVDPFEAIVRSGQACNVDTVLVDGRTLKYGGRLTAIDVAAVVADATDSLAALRRRAAAS